MRSPRSRNRDVLGPGMVGFGSQRGVLLYWFAGVFEGERELAVVRAAGGRELLDGEVLVVALEHPPPRPRQQLLTRSLAGARVRVRGRRARATGWSSWISSRVDARARESAV